MTEPVAPWRLGVASAIVGLLGIGLAAAAWTSQPLSIDETPASVTGADATSGTTASSSSTVAPLVTVSSSGTNDDEVRRTVHGALAAWGEFAASGDLQDVEAFFDPGGPQWASLSTEAGSVGAAFTAEIVQRSLHPDAGSMVFVGDIMLASNGETRVISWTIKLRRAPDGHWRIWSISETAP